MVATTIEQAKRLIELGLDPATADGYNTPDGGFSTFPVACSDGGFYDKERVWSLDALLSVMDEVSLDKYGDCYNMDYAFKGLFTDTHDNPIDCAVQMVEMMLEKGLIKKVKDDSNND